MGTRKRVRKIKGGKDFTNPMLTMRRKKTNSVKMLMPLDGPANWPDLAGCEISRIESVLLEPGMVVDRFGGIKGQYVAIMRRPPTKRGETPSTECIPATFKERSLRSLSETKLPFNISKYLRKIGQPIDGPDIIIPDFREEMYLDMYNHTNDPENKLYYILKVLRPIKALAPCKARPWFDYDGGALQLQLPASIEELLDMHQADGGGPYLRKLSSEEIKGLIGDYFPPYSGEKIEDAKFEPYDGALINVVKANYPYPKDANRDYLRQYVFGLESDSNLFRSIKPATIIGKRTAVPAGRIPSQYLLSPLPQPIFPLRSPVVASPHAIPPLPASPPSSPRTPPSTPSSQTRRSARNGYTPGAPPSPSSPTRRSARNGYISGTPSGRSARSLGMFPNISQRLPF
jgi:hypothetical protein